MILIDIYVILHSNLYIFYRQELSLYKFILWYIKKYAIAFKYNYELIYFLLLLLFFVEVEFIL